MEDADAQRLFLEYTPRTRTLAGFYCRRVIVSRQVKQDIHSESLIGLWKACLRFDPLYKYKFWTLGRRLVRGAIIDFLRRERIFVRGDRQTANIKFDTIEFRPLSEDNFHEFYSFGEPIDLSDKRSALEINKIEVGRIIDSGTNGMSRDKKEIIKSFYCDGQLIEDMSLNGKKEWYARTAIIEGIQELRSRNVMGVA